jgi:Winged helix DNA-binding domain
MHSNLLRQRLRNQHVTGKPLARPEDVVRLLGAVQSQDYPGAKWSLGQRVRGCTDKAIDEAFSAGRILRTHVLRPTWHFVLPEDIKWILELTAPRVQSLNAYVYRTEQLDKALLARAHKAFANALRDEVFLTRLELANELSKVGIVAEKNRLAYIVMHAELEGLVCSGPLKGKQHTYALLEERAPNAKRLDRDEALAQLVFRFLTGHAPATIKHFVWWSGLTRADALRGLAAARSDLGEPVSFENAEWFGLSKTPPRDEKLMAYLIPEYDEALTGYRDLGTADFPPGKPDKSWRDVFYRPVVVDYMRAGTWKRTMGQKSATMELNLFAKLNEVHWRAVESAIDRYSRFLEMPVTLNS